MRFQSSERIASHPQAKTARALAMKPALAAIRRKGTSERYPKNGGPALVFAFFSRRGSRHSGCCQTRTQSTSMRAVLVESEP